MKGNKVYINNDQTIQEREIQKFIRDRAREERQRGKSVIVKYQRLIIDGKQWKWNTNRDALEPVYINNDQTIQEREIQKFIRDRAREERQRGKSVIVKYQRLIIDGKQWKWNTNRDALEPVKDTHC
ncbi:hypothetical protein QE152_g15506 [Popillia japonica]|uniref:Uncharacterized protein n=1 Tax=Popillia japonica TaxID=7064 RepID=A0AAW1L5H7_POPJA